MPPKYVKWKREAALFLRAPKDWDPEGTFTLRCLFVFPMTGKPLVRSKRPRRIKATLPDIDNLFKSVMDAGEGELWSNDGKIASIVGRKVYGAQGEEPHVWVTVERMDV